MAGRLNRLRAPGLHPRTLLVLTGAVLLAHGCVVDQIAQAVTAWSVEAGLPPRLQVAYVRELMPTDAPPPAPAPAIERTVPQPLAPRAPRAPSRPPPADDLPQPPDPAASAPDAPAEAPVQPPPVVREVAAVAQAPVSVPAASEPVPAASAPGAPVAESLADGPPDAPPFEWPASTRLSYRLSGQYRGEVHGQAQVEWVLALPRYQVNMDVSVGLPIAPLYTRRMRSDGRLSAAGLHPERYDEVSQLAFRDRRQVSLVLGDDGVTLADGRRWTPPAAAAGPIDGATAVQDSASQFVQLSYLFTVQPQRLVPGAMIGFPLALPRRVEPWVYEVVAAETVYTPFGPLETFHVRPRRGTPRGNDLLAEAWFSPQLAYLPVRIRIEQDTETFLDLMLDRRPELAAR